MVYTRITRTRNGREAIEYAKGNDKGHNGKDFRNEFISIVNMFEGIDPIEQMQKYWLKASKNHETQALRIVQSFSKNEFDPENPNDILSANTLGTEYVTKHYPGRQAMIFTQTDGKGGFIHNHIIINDVHMETGKACDKNQYYWPQLTEWTDELTSLYTELDYGEKSKDKTSQTERAKRELGRYVWKDDLKKRIEKSMNEADSKDDFLKRLEINGIGVRKGKSKIHGEYFTYELIDLSNLPEGENLPNRKLKVRSFKLGEDYGPNSLEIKLSNKSKKKESIIVNEKVVDKKDDFTKTVAEIQKRVNEKLKAEKEKEKLEKERLEKQRLEEERLEKEKLEREMLEKQRQREVEKVMKDNFNYEVDYSKSTKKDNEEIKEQVEKKQRNQKALREEIKRNSRGKASNRWSKEQLAKMNRLMSNIEQKQDEGIEFY